MSVTVNDHSAEVQSAIQAAITEGLNDAGSIAVENAKSTVHVITGNLRDSIDHQVSGNTVTIYAGMEYAAYEELGTSRQPSHPYLRPAVVDHTDQLKQAIANKISSLL